MYCTVCMYCMIVHRTNKFDETDHYYYLHLRISCMTEKTSCHMKRSRNNNLFIQPAFFGTYGRQKSVLLHSLYTEKAQHFAISNKAGMAHGRCTPDERERLICIYCEGSGVIRSQGRKVVKPFGKSFRASSSEIEGNTTVSYRHTSMKHWKNTTWLENTRMQKKKNTLPRCQSTGQATLCLSVSCKASTQRRTSSKLRPVGAGYVMLQE